MARYIAGCVKYQKSKIDRHGRQMKLVSMLIEECHFVNIAIDFIGELLESKGYNTILVITDCLTKVLQYILV